MLSSIETRKSKGQEYYVAVVDGKELEIEVPIDRLLTDIKKFNQATDNHHFAG
jgi:hypothetical protein